MKMNALVMEEYKQFRFAEVDAPEPRPGEVLIRVRACAVCGSDVHGIDGSTGRRRPPIVMGHEASGEIAALGEGVEGWSVGDRVTFDSTVYCNTCDACRAGKVNLCANRRVLGVSCEDYRRDGAFAQYIVMVPRLDLAVVINSVSYRLNGWLELGHIWDILAPAVHDTPLAASPREQALVEQAIARGEKNEITPARGKAKSPEKWGKFRHFDLQLDSNVLNLERMALTLDKGLMQVDMNGVTTAIAAHGKWHEHLGTPAPLPPYNVKARNRMAGLTPDFRCAASYAWQDGHTLVLRMEWPTWYAGRTLTLDLQARTLTIVNNWAQQSPIVIPVTAVTH